ncbi:4'-phosphopantetheinyl transferase superfamily protein, partial [bacterium]|nr:4'-phosphopantetheinyl transferase superfamily protein [bacterium]
MILGLGVDIVFVPRLARAIERHGARLRRRIFAEDEAAPHDAGGFSPEEAAMRFAAKEAFLKAVRRGIFDMPLRDIVTVRDGRGWRIDARGRAARILNLPADARIHVDAALGG